MHIRAFGLKATILLRDEFLSWKVLRDAKSMGTAAVGHTYVIICHIICEEKECGSGSLDDRQILQGRLV